MTARTINVRLPEALYNQIEELATGLRQLRAQVVDLIGLGVKTCPYKRLICWV